jgi:endothelin-converting enzyme/putative endopeptidase
VAGGISLPNRDYCVKQDADKARIRSRYRAHVAQIFELLGDTPAAARIHAVTVLAVETALARASLGTAEKRDPYKTFHKFNARGLQALTPDFDWAAYRVALGVAPDLDVYNVTEPAYYKAFSTLLARSSLAEIHAR